MTGNSVKLYSPHKEVNYFLYHDLCVGVIPINKLRNSWPICMIIFVHVVGRTLQQKVCRIWDFVLLYHNIRIKNWQLDLRCICICTPHSKIEKNLLHSHMQPNRHANRFCICSHLLLVNADFILDGVFNWKRVEILRINSYHSRPDIWMLPDLKDSIKLITPTYCTRNVLLEPSPTRFSFFF